MLVLFNQATAGGTQFKCLQPNLQREKINLKAYVNLEAKCILSR